MALNLETLSVALRLDGGPFKSGMTQAQAQLNGFRDRLSSVGESVTNFGQRMTTFVTLPLIGLGTAFVKWASDVDESTSAVTQVYGEGADFIIDKSEDAAHAVFLSQGEYLEAAATLGVYGDAAGLTGDELSAFGDSNITAAADLASFYNAAGGVPAVLEAIKSGLVGEYEPLRQYGIVLNEAAVNEYAWANGIAVRGEALTEQQKILARHGLIMESLGAAEGDAQRTADGLANSTRRLQARFKDIGATIGRILLPVAMRLVDAVGDLFDWVEDLSPAVLKWAVVIAAAAAAIGPLAIGLGFLISGFGTLIGVIAFFLSPIGLVIAAVGLLAYVFRDELGAAIDWIVDKFGELKTVFDDYLAISGDPMLAALGALQKVFPQLTDVVGHLRDALNAFRAGDYAGMFWGIWDAVSALGSAVISAFASVDWAGIASAIGGWIRNALSTMGSLATELAPKGWELILGLYSGLEERWPAISSWLAGVGVKAVGAIGELGESLISKGQALIGGLLRGIEERWPAVQSWLAGLGGKALAAIPGIADSLLSKGQALIGGFLQGARERWNDVVSWLGTLAGLAAAALPLVGSVLEDRGRALLGGFYRGVVNYWNDTVVPWFSGIDWSGITSALADGFMAAVGGAFDFGKLSGGLSFDIGTSILNWLTRQIESIEWDGFGERVGRASAAAIATAFKGLAALGSIAVALGAGLIAAVMDADWSSVAGAIVAFLVAALRGYHEFMNAAFKGLFSGLIGAVREALENASEPIRTWVNKVIGWVNQVIEALNKIPGTDIPLINPILSETENYLAKVRDRATEAAQAFREGAKALKALADTGGGYAGGTDEPTDEPLPAVPLPPAVQGNPKMGGLSGMASAIRDITAAANDATGSVGAFKSAVGTVGIVGGASFAGLKAAFDVSVPPIGIGFGTAATWPAAPLAALASIKGGFDTTLPALVARSQTSFSAAKSAAVSNVDSMKASVGSSISSMSSSTISSIGAMNLKVIDRATNMSNSVKTTFMNMNTAAATQTSIMNTITGAAFTTMTTRASSAMTSMRSAVSSGMAAVVATVRSGMSSAVSAASGMSGAFYGAGADAIQGLVNGAASRLGALQSVVSQAIAIMARIPALGNSPWPMMIGAGHDAMDGLTGGVRDRMSNLNRAIDDVIGTFSSASPAMSGSIRGVGAISGAGSAPVVNNYGPYIVTLPTEEWVEVATAARTAPERVANLMQKARSLQPWGEG